MREARHALARFVHTQTRLLRQCANLALGQLRRHQRSDRMMLSGRPLPRTKLARSSIFIP